MDCSTENYACKGGQPSAVMDYVVANYLSLEKDYPYIMKKNAACYKDDRVVPKAAGGRRLQDEEPGFGNAVLSQFSLREFNRNRNQ